MFVLLVRSLACDIIALRLTNFRAKAFWVFQFWKFMKFVFIGSNHNRRSITRERDSLNLSLSSVYTIYRRGNYGSPSRRRLTYTWSQFIPVSHPTHSGHVYRSQVSNKPARPCSVWGNRRTQGQTHAVTWRTYKPYSQDGTRLHGAARQHLYCCATLALRPVFEW